MTNPRVPKFDLRECFALAAFACFACFAFAQPSPDGTVEGRVLNAGNGSYLTNARGTIEGSTLETFTDSFGFFNARNITNVAQDIQRYGPTTPSWARTYRREEFGVQYTLGIKGQF